MAKANDKEKELIHQYLLQFLSIEKEYPLLPGKNNTEALAGFVGITEEEFSLSRSNFNENARQAALEVLKDEEIIDLIDDLPFDSDDTIVAYGDSITGDLQGWFTILQHVLEISVNAADFKFVNAGVAYETTTEALKRIDRDVLSHSPDWVFVALGTFDAQRLNVATNRTLVSLSDTWENLNLVQEVLTEEVENDLIWITPPTVITELLDQNPLYDFTIEKQDLAQIQELVSGKKGFVVDPRAIRMGTQGPQAWNYLSDGLHPSLSGHIETVKFILKTMVSKGEE